MGMVGRLVAALQDRLWAADELAAAESGWTSRRIGRGWAVEVRDPQRVRRRVCGACAGSGRDPISGCGCGPCSGVGVVTAAGVEPGGVR